jgi:uncharacterized membrane protein SpoIIM required for sporulation
MSTLNPQQEQDIKQLLNLIQGGPRGLRRRTAEEIRQVDIAFRNTRTLLSQVRSRVVDPDLVRHLSSVLARAHLLLSTVARPAPSLPSLMVTVAFARIVARTWKFHALAALVFFLGAGVAYHAVMTDPMAAYAIMPENETRLPGTSPEMLMRYLEHGRDMGSGMKLVFAAQLLSNNTRVGLLSMLSGVAAGVPTVFLVLYNGAIFGSFVATHHRAGIHEDLWAWILPHGVPEIWAIILMSGMGFRLGAAVVSPGRLSRGRSLLSAGREAMVVACGCALLLLIAAAIESYIRQSHLSTEFRHGISISGFLILSLYFAGGAWIERKTQRMHRLGLPAQADGESTSPQHGAL